MADSDPALTRRAAILIALAANIAVAVAKGAAAALTGSSAMLAEALHSVADSSNEVLLLVGAKRSLRPADLRHPFGHARYRYLYAFVVSLAVFWVGGALSVVEGIQHVITPAAIVDPRWAFAVLAFAAILDGWSLRTTTGAWAGARGQLTWRRLLRETKAPELNGGWLDSHGAENGDKCAWISSGQGASQSVQIGSASFPVQSLWSNAFNGGRGGCVLAY